MQFQQVVIVGRSLAVAILLFVVLGVPLALWVARRLANRARLVIRALVLTAVLLPLLCFLLLYTTPQLFFWLTCKEGVLELATLPFLLMAAAVFFDGYRTGRMRRFAVAWAALCLVVFAEEIDWGQLVLGFPTPGFLRPCTGRSDLLNFHNTAVASLAFGLIVLFVFVLLPLAARRPAWSARLHRWGIQAPSLLVAGAVLVLVLGWNTLSLVLGIDAQLQEVTELGLALLLLALALEWWWAGNSEEKDVSS
jgi:hypothetical protein